MESIRLLDIAGIVSFILGSLAFLLTYIRASINKSNRTIDQNTISSQKENIVALEGEKNMWRERALDAEGQNKVLTNVVTAAPEVAQLIEQTAKQHAQNTKWQQETTKFQARLLKSFEMLVNSQNVKSNGGP